MSYSFEESSSEKKFKGVRRRKWGKWVSEIRVPGTQERLWLGSFSTPEAAAVAHDVAYYCLRRPISLQSLNFPLNVPAGVSPDMSPRSIQQAASDAGMAVDAQFISGNRTRESFMKTEEEEEEEGRDLHGRFEEEFMEGAGEASAAWEDEKALSISDYL